MKLSIFVCYGLRIISGQNQAKPRLLRECQPSLMKVDGIWFRWYTDSREGLLLDMFGVRFAEVRVGCEKKIANGEVYPCLFVVHPDSPIAQRYNFKACERYSEEEEKLALDHNKSFQEEEACGIKLDLDIQDLAIA